MSGRGLLVIGQVALAVVLVIGAALMIESLARLHHVNPGFEPADILTMHVSLPVARYDTAGKRSSFFEDLLRRVDALPGIRAATVTFTLPSTAWAGTPVQLADQPPLKLNERPISRYQVATPGYLTTFGIPLKRGREFTERDAINAPPVAIVNEAFALRFWPAYPAGPSPIGRRIIIGGTSKDSVEIVGIVGNVHNLDAEPAPEAYVPYTQTAPSAAVLAVRTARDPMSLLSAVRTQVLAIDRDQPVTAVRTMNEVLDESVAQQRMTMLLLETFAAIALLLAVVGIYGVIAFSVVQRTREMGIRRALGAQQSNILGLVLGQSLGLSAAGVVFGIAGAFGLTRLIRKFLFGVSATDPATFTAIAILFILIALAAAYIPARRASRSDPMSALRS